MDSNQKTLLNIHILIRSVSDYSIEVECDSIMVFISEYQHNNRS